MQGGATQAMLVCIVEERQRPQMPPCRRNPKGTWVLRAISALLVVNDAQRHPQPLKP